MPQFFGTPILSESERVLAVAAGTGNGASPTPQHGGAKRIGFAVAAALLAIILALFLAEIVLRGGGYHWRPVTSDEGTPVIFEPDAELGWRHQPGTYTQWPARNIRVTIWPDGSRATGISPLEAGQTLLLVGGSFTEGWAISDEETLAWKLQARMPQFRVRNYGTGGYGTYQSLLLLRRLLGQGIQPRIVLYGFCDIHDKRNIAETGWLRTLSRMASRGHVAVPYCSIDADNRLVEMPPRSYPAKGLVRSLAVVDSGVRLVMRIADRRRIRHMRAITGELIENMHMLCSRHATQFIVIVYRCRPASRAAYFSHFRDKGIRFIDCTGITIHEVADDPHPDGATNSRWADMVAETLAE